MRKFHTIALAAMAVVACNNDDTKIKIESMTLVPETATVFIDEALPELALNVTPESALEGKTVVWTSSEPDIISVSQEGIISFEVPDIEETERTVVITAELDGVKANSTITVKGQIAKYNVIDLSAEAGLLMLDRNVGASAVGQSGNYYQWGNNTAVAAEGEKKVNANYSADWAYDKATDWTVPENTPCPKGWGIPDGNQMGRLAKVLDAIALYEWDMATDEEYDAAIALLKKMQLSNCGQFNKKTGEIYLSEASYFWAAYVSEDHTTVGDFEYNSFPTYRKLATFDLAIPVRCVKNAE